MRMRDAIQGRGNCMRNSEIARPMGVMRCRRRRRRWRSRWRRRWSRRWRTRGLAWWAPSALANCPLTLSVHMTPSVRTRPSIRPDVSPHIRYGGYSRPSMTQPPPTPTFPHQQTKRAQQNQHVASFNPRKAAPRGGLPRVTSRRSAHEPDMGRHLAGCSTGSVDFRTRWTSSALIVSS